jgi:hypothetical protein
VKYLFQFVERFLRSPLRRLPQLRKREAAALLILLVLIIAGVMLALRDESPEVRLAADRLSFHEPLEITGERWDGSGKGTARTKALILSTALASEDAASDSRSGEVEVVLPVAGQACGGLRAAFGGSCGRPGVDQPLSRRLTLLWIDTGKVTIEADRARLATFGQTPVLGEPVRGDSWNLRFDAIRTVIEFQCPQPSRFWLVFRGRTEMQRCARDGAELRFNFSLEDSSVAKIFLGGLQHFQFAASGTRATLAVARGELFVDERQSDLVGGSTPVVIASRDANALSAEIDNREGKPHPSVSVDTASATTIELNNRSRLPSLFSGYKDIWLLFFGAALGMGLSVGSERIAPSEKTAPP